LDNGEEEERYRESKEERYKNLENYLTKVRIKKEREGRKEIKIMQQREAG
jgi:hypothetical protein